MTDLTIRKIPFRFEGVDFIWNPANPRFAIEMNRVSFFAIGLEKYYCQAARDAEAFIDDPDVLREARDFRAQEGIHARSHRQHVSALIARYPGLQDTLDALIAHFDDLYEARDLDYHLAYAGGLESIFTPVFKLHLDNREALFAAGDARVASLFLWHFCEEIEHRSSALMIYDEVVGNYWFRLKNFISFMKHVGQGLDIVEQGFRQHVPDVPEEYYRLPAYSGVSKWDAVKAVFGVFQSQMPWHVAENQDIPDYFHEWNRRYDSGEDMTQVYGVVPAQGDRA